MTCHDICQLQMYQRASRAAALVMSHVTMYDETLLLPMFSDLATPRHIISQAFVRETHMCHLRVAKCESPVCHFRNTPSIHITGVLAWAIIDHELSSHYTRVLYATLTTQRSSISQASIHEAYYERSSISQASIHEAYVLRVRCMNTPRYKSTLTHAPPYTSQSFDRGWSSCVPRRTHVCDPPLSPHATQML